MCCLLAVALQLVFVSTVFANELRRLTADEIIALLSGNTAVGLWDGKPYRQYFASYGETIYAQPDTRSSVGKWRVNRTENVYESWWEMSDWSSYPVASDGKNMYWISNSLPPQKFSVLAGNQLVKK